MGWGGGSAIAEEMIDAIQKENLEPDVKKNLYRALLDSLTDRDWDNVDEVMGLDEDFDEVVKEWNPAYCQEEED